MWTASLARIALSATLAVAGGLSLVGVLASLPTQDPAPSRPVPAVSGPGAAPADATREDGSGPAARHAAELTQAIERLEDTLAAASAAVAKAGQTAQAGLSATATEGPAPDTVAAIAPAAGRPVPGLAGDPVPPASGGMAQQSAELPARQAAERPAPEDISDEEARSEREALVGPYLPSTMRAGAQSAAAQPAHAPAVAGPAAPMPPDAEPAAAPAAASQAGDPQATDEQAADPQAIGFVIIGSFQQEANAARHVGNHRDWLPQILTKQVGGTTQYRVAIGPFRAADLPDARQRIIAGGIPDAWLLPLGKAVATPLQPLDILG